MNDDAFIHALGFMAEGPWELSHDMNITKIKNGVQEERDFDKYAIHQII
jgi:hypothetical protein